MSRGIDQVGIFDFVMADKSVVDCFFVVEMGVKVKRRVKGSAREAGREAGNHKSCEEQTAPGIDHASTYKHKEMSIKQTQTQGNCLTGPTRIPVLDLKRKDGMSLSRLSSPSLSRQ